ncbi:hypothetical protein MASR1M65_28310 [Saprospiraceae bacterium]
MLPLLNMMLYYIIAEGLEAKEFIDKRTEGYDEFRTQVLNIDLSKMEEITGVDRALVKKAAIAYATAPLAMSFHGLGVTEHFQGTYAVMQIADLAMITGNIGKKGCGVNPLRGQNNVQGAADMGAQPYQGAGYLDVTDPEIHKRYEAFYGAKLPMHEGYKIPEMYDAALEGKFKALWLIGEDIVQTEPNTNKVKASLEQLDLLVVQEIFMTETASFADVILPAATFLEKSGTFTNGERRIQRVNQVVKPLEGTKPDGQIIVEIMNRMGYAQPDYHPDTMLQEISQIVPFFKGVKWNESRHQRQSERPVKEDGTDTRILHTETFTRGKGKFRFKDFTETEEITTYGKQYPYILTTNRELEHYNAGTMTRRTNNAIILSDDYLLINPNDAVKHAINNGDMVCIESPRGKVDVKARVTDEVKPGILSTTFHFPEVMINIVTSDVHDEHAKCPEYKVVSVNIRKSKGKYKVT